MKIQKAQTKQQLIQRLARIEGQLRGLQVMLGEERDCHDIMQQLSAANSALQSASRIFLQDYAAMCLAQMDSSQADQPSVELQAQRTELVREMVGMLGKAP